MSFTFEEADEYAAAHTTPAPEPLVQLGEETESTQDAPQMSVGALEGAFLRFMVAMKQPRLVLVVVVNFAFIEAVIAAGNDIQAEGKQILRNRWCNSETTGTVFAVCNGEIDFVLGDEIV